MMLTSVMSLLADQEGGVPGGARGDVTGFAPPTGSLTVTDVTW